MIDFLLGALLVALLVRGWMRGLVREAVGLAVIVVGIFLAFRLSSPAGAVVAAMAGTGADVSRFIGGVAVFLLVSVGGAVVAFVLHRGVRFLPGLPTMNRAAGAGFAVLAGVLAATVAVSVLVLMPVGESWRQRVDDSVIASTLVEPDGLPQTVMAVIGGDRVIGTVLDLEDLVGTRRLVGATSHVSLPPTDPDDLAHADRESSKVYDLLNATRVASGVDPLTRSDVLDGVAAELAFDVYATGRFWTAGDVEGRVEAAGLPVVRATELIGLGVTPASVHEGLVAEPRSAEIMAREDYRRIGVGAVEGPLGLVTVVLFAA